MAKFTTELIKVGDVWTLKFLNEINSGHLPSIWAVDLLNEAVKAQAQFFVIDLAAVEIVDSQGLKFLLDLHKTFAKSDIQIVLQNPNSRMRRLLRIMQFNRIFVITGE